MAVGLAVAIVALGAYVTVRMQLQSSLDESLVDRADGRGRGSSTRSPQRPTCRRSCSVRPTYAIGFIEFDGHVAASSDQRRRDPARRPRARGGRGDAKLSLRTVRAGGVDYRVVAVPPRATGHRAGGRPVAGAPAARAHQARAGDAALRRRRGGRRRAGRLGGGPQRPAAGAAAHRGRRGHRPHRGAGTRSRSRATTRSPGWRRRSTRCSPRSPPPGTGSAGWSPTPATSCARR